MSDPKNAPERIWRVGGQIDLPGGARLTTPDNHDFGLSVEYVHVCLFNELSEELNRLREVIREASDDLLGMVDDCNDGELGEESLIGLSESLMSSITPSNATKEDEDA